MKKAFIVLLVVVGLLFTVGNAFATQGDVYAKILGTPATLSEDSDVKLGFGGIIRDTDVSNAADGTMTLTPVDESGNVIVSTTDGLIYTTTGTTHNGEAGAGYDGTLTSGFTPLLSAGKFEASGLSASTKYDIYLPSVVPLTATVVATPYTIYASNFKAYTTETADGFAERSNFTTAAGGSDTARNILIGAKLTVPKDAAVAPAGNYSGTYTIFLYADE